MTKVKRRKANKVVSILTTCTFLYLFIAMFVFSAINSSANIEVEDLQKDNYLERIPVPLDKSRDSSCYYVATGKEFIC